MSKRILTFFCFFILLGSAVKAQVTYKMKDTTVRDCDGILTDSDALFGGLYGMNEDFTFSICPGTGATIYFNFTFLSLEQGNDTIFFYDGPSTASPLLVAYTGTPSPVPPLITATSGCMTIHFVSDGTLQLTGWNGSWTSIAPPIVAPILNVSTIEPPACDSNSFLIEFDRKLHCDSIVSAATNIIGYNAPTVTNITKVNCVNDSSRFARVWLNTPFVNNCQYFLVMDIKIPDVCDSVYNFTVRDTFDFVNCDLLAQLSPDDSVCFGDCKPIEVTNTPSCNTLSYSWSNGLPSTAGPHLVCPTVTTTYYVTVTESSSGKQYIDSVTIKVLDTLNKDIGITVDNTAEPPLCNNRWFRVKFNKSIPCDLLDSVTFTLTSSVGTFNVTNQNPINCTNNMLDSVRLRINPRFLRNCEYYLTFNLSFTDSCEGPISIIARDTFSITDCPFSINTTYNDSLCLNTCTNVSTVPSGCSGYNYVWSNGWPNSPGPFNLCPTGDTIIYLQVTEISTGLVINDTINVKVLDPTINPVAPMCSYDLPINLTANTMGGTWSGPGITNSSLGTFNPNSAGNGTHLITYTINSCTDTVLIIVTRPDARWNRNLCASGIPVNLAAGLPTGGTWSGTHVNSTTNQFTPVVYGNFTAYYTVNGCTDSINVFVDTIALGYDTDTVCGNSVPFNLPFSPTGGNWSGTGITNATLGTFNPAIANSGSNLVRYYYRGCRDTINMVVVQVNAGPDTNACPMQPAFNLSPGSPMGGVWKGVGITDTNAGTFNPGTLTGNWMSTISYSFKGCADTLQMDIIQTNVIPDTIFICPSQDSILITSIPGVSVQPNYGVWSGTGVTAYGTNYYLYPRFLGNGFHMIYYDKNTCQDSLMVAIYPDTLSYRDTTVCSIQSPFKLDSINNMPGATWQGTGITNANTGLFSPAVAGSGTHVITYKTIGGVCDKTIRVTVYQFNLANINLQDTFCFTNQNYAIPSTPTGGTWSGAGTYNKTLGIFNPAVAGPGTHQIIYSVGSGVCFTSDEKNVFVRDSILADLKTSADTICAGNSATLIGSAVGGYPNPSYTYSWSHTTSTTSSQSVSPLTTTQYTLTVDDGCSDSSSDTATITVLSITPTLYTSPSVCYGEIGYATFDLAQKAVYTFNWTKPSVLGDTVFGVGKDSAYLRVSNSFGCYIDTFLVIPGYDYLKADFGLNPDTYPKCISSDSKKLIVTDQSIGAITGGWDFGDGSTPMPYNPSNTSETYIYANGGNYIVTLIVKNSGPCYDTLTKEICVSDEKFFIADIFSPNGDGVNDMLFVRSSEAEKLEFFVFDRWGKLVFESNDVNNGWDGNYKGKAAEAGVYFYSVKMTLSSGEKIIKKGDVTLKR